MRKVILLIIAALFLNGCIQVVALVGPAVTGAASGNIYQSAISYSLGYGVKKATGKSIIENVIDVAKDKEKITKTGKNGELIHSFSNDFTESFFKLHN